MHGLQIGLQSGERTLRFDVVFVVLQLERFAKQMRRGRLSVGIQQIDDVVFGRLFAEQDGIVRLRQVRSRPRLLFQRFRLRVVAGMPEQQMRRVVVFDLPDGKQP